MFIQTQYLLNNSPFSVCNLGAHTYKWEVNCNKSKLNLYKKFVIAILLKDKKMYNIEDTTYFEY